MGASDVDASMRMLVRHQWVREHGTPRVTTLVGRPDAARALWSEWLSLTGRPRSQRRLFEQPTRATERWLATIAARATAAATATPREAIAIVVEPDVLARWLEGNHDRQAAFIAEGVVNVAARRRPALRTGGQGSSLVADRARSLAELTLLEALEATPATAGRFQLNQHVSFHFGTRAVEIDLLSRSDDLAIEVDGFHHFTDLDNYRRDRRKDLLLQAHGYAVLRFLADDVLADPRATVQLVLEFLGHRLARERLHRKG